MKKPKNRHEKLLPDTIWPTAELAGYHEWELRYRRKKLSREDQLEIATILEAYKYLREHPNKDMEQKNIALQKLKELAELERDHLKERFNKLFQDYSAQFNEIEELKRQLSAAREALAMASNLLDNIKPLPGTTPFEETDG